MTLSEAKKAISGKLTFGNEEQVKALAFLEAVAECADAIEASEDIGGFSNEVIGAATEDLHAR
jgi:hypothetical protein